jgi:hypothetical protein
MYFLFVEMNFQARWRVVVVMIVAVACWYFVWFRRRVADAWSVSTGL